MKLRRSSAIELAESLSGAGPPVGEPLCHFEAGFQAGVPGHLLRPRLRVRETACGATMDRRCSFVAPLEPRN